ncbi:MAG: hypothetical protein N4P99_05115 [Lactobacillus iners]|nr:hypothetical protein [Lactobacillus iners]
MTTAINIFLRTTIRENGIPFSLKLEARMIQRLLLLRKEDGLRLILV